MVLNESWEYKNRLGLLNAGRAVQSLARSCKFHIQTITFQNEHQEKMTSFAEFIYEYHAPVSDVMRCSSCPHNLFNKRSLNAVGMVMYYIIINKWYIIIIVWVYSAYGKWSMCYNIHALTLPFACIFVHGSLESKLTLNILGDSMGRITKGQINYRINLQLL